MAALDKPHDEMLADVVAYGQAVKKLADQYTVTIFKAHALDIRRRKLHMAAVQSQNEEVAETLNDLSLFYAWIQKDERLNRHLSFTSLATWKIHLKHYAHVLERIYTAEERQAQDWTTTASPSFQAEFCHRAKTLNIATQKDCKGLKTAAHDIMDKIHVDPEFIQQLQLQNEALKQQLGELEQLQELDLPPMERRGFNLGVTGNNLRYRLKPNDRIYTPGPIAQSIVDMLTLQEGDVVLEPCYGGGAIYDRIPDGVEKRWCEIDQGRDFLEYEADDVDVIVTNPVS